MKDNKREPKTLPKSASGRRGGGSGGAGKPVMAAVADRPEEQKSRWIWIAAFLAAAAVVFEVYSPALNGPFLLDDTYLPFMLPGWDNVPLWLWLNGVRPLLMLSFWLNFQIGGHEPNSYHIVNIVIHLLNGGLVFAILNRILARVDLEIWRRYVLAGFGAALFLCHPLQTESVAYVASRSETLSVFFAYLALAVFVWRRREEISWGASVGVLAAFGAACATKEQALVLPAAFVVTDYFWNPGFSLRGAVRNWRLYVLAACAAVAGLIALIPLLARANSAGFHLRGVNWMQYFFTQCRAIWIYIGKFVVPIHQNIDYDFPISHTITEHGAILFLIGLLVVTVAAWIFRRSVPLASYGWFMFLVLIAPTSSLVPIADPFVERRLYFPFIGLLFVVMEVLRRWRATRQTLIGALAVVIVIEAGLAYRRNERWGDKIAMWQDAAAKSPNKLRPQFQLAHAYFDAGRFSESIVSYENAAKIRRPRFDLLVDWGLALSYAGRNDEAQEKLTQAARLEPSAYVYTQIAMVDGRSGRLDDALAALTIAERKDPKLAVIYDYRGVVYMKQGDPARAAAEFRRGLSFDPNNARLRDLLAEAQQASGKP